MRHSYFLGGYDPYAKLIRVLGARINEEAWSALGRTQSMPLAAPETGKIAVKGINHYGDEVMKVYGVG